MRKFYLVFVMLVGLSSAAYAQSFFRGGGYYLANGKGPANSKTQAGIDSSIRESQYLGFGYNLSFHIPLYQINDETSLGLNTGISAGGAYIYSLLSPLYGITARIPVMAQLNYGNFSSGNSSKDVGFGIGAGLNYSYIYVRHFANLRNTASYEIGAFGALQPVAGISFRWWGKENNLRTLNLTAEFGGSNELPVSGRPFSRNAIILSQVIYLNY